MALPSSSASSSRRPSLTMSSLAALLLISLLLSSLISPTRATVTCSDDAYCELQLRPGSKCINGACSNPFSHGGCLANMLPDWHKIRVCGSDDSPEALQNGDCRAPPFSTYPEVRLAVANWESAYMAGWIFQILLSEVLEVPVSIELGMPGLSADFYDPQNRWDWGAGTNMEALRRAHELGGDCRSGTSGYGEDDKAEADVTQATEDADQNTTTNSNLPRGGCANMNPECWRNSYIGTLREMEDDGVITRPSSLGVSAKEDVVIPDRTAALDPSLLSFHGLRGEENRHKLAALFQTPTTWGEYCSLVSTDNCSTSPLTVLNKTVAVRPPKDQEEAKMYYVPELYQGHFRTTPQNNCTLHPDTCAGIFLDYPCEWSHNTVQKLVWMDIRLQAVPFDYGDLLQINQAANATKAHTIGAWWKPDPLNELWRGTDSQLTPINLPPATQECIHHKNGLENRCVGNIQQEAGSPLGACEDPPNPLATLLSAPLVALNENPNLDPALWSPSHLFAERFEITMLQYNLIFQKWLDRGVDKWNYDLRHATCEFLVEHYYEELQSFFPKTFPRTLQPINIDGSGAQIASRTLSVVALILIVGAFIGTHRRRNTKIMYHTQLGIIYAVLGGLFLVAIGALLLTFPATDALCPTPYWFSNLGYAMEFAPILVKVDAINNAVRAGRAMHRVRIPTRHIRRALCVGVGFVGAITLTWMLVHPSEQAISYELLTGEASVTENGETIVTSSAYCESKSPWWAVSTFLFFAGVLLYGLVLAFMASRVREDMNGSRNYATLLSCHVVTVGFRAAVFLLDESVNAAYMRLYTSIMLSIDCIAAVCVFCGPKLYEKTELQNSEEPLPDLFLETTVVMCDIAGFTKWASMREPTAVFQLLEAIFAEFDQICHRRRLLKIETVGDSYVAAAGIPNPQKDHAVQGGRFAIDCMSRMHLLVSEMEVTFGPDTSELSLRIGMNSGAVTGGFLRGKGARFQLFGDVVNTTGRLESSGEVGRIHVSEAYAEALRRVGKECWVKKREDTVHAKGKGALSTYWLVHGSEQADCETSETFNKDHHAWLNRESSPEEQRYRLVRWNAEVLLAVLKEIVACRVAAATPRMLVTASADSIDECETEPPEMPLEEVKEIITLPQFDRRVATRRADAEAVEIPEIVVEQLQDLVNSIAYLYKDNPFHNFQHASHVVMAATKYLSRINAAPDLDSDMDRSMKVDPFSRSGTKAARLHDHTYGITSDPTCHFAILFSALIHDVDHPGVPNGRLVEENEELGKKYKNRSVAEQNSFDLAWNLLSESRFDELRKTLFTDHKEMDRFRQLVINSVMATDLGDKELKLLRNNRWEKAFAKSDDTESLKSFTSSIVDGYSESMHAAVNRKATIVIEHVIQAADVSHTMQHWHVYRQWNQNLFREMYLAYKMGRAEKNPADFWYEGEIGFFDFYIIPLSEKLRDCGVFGVSSDENLSYATANRAEWVAKGKDVVAEMLQQLEGVQQPVPFGDIVLVEEQYPQEDAETQVAVA